MQDLRKIGALLAIALALALAAWVLWPRRTPPAVVVAPPPPSPRASPRPSASPIPLAPRGDATLDGRVVDPDGHPIAGARVDVGGVGLSATLAPSRLLAEGELGVLKGPIPYPPAQPLPLGPSTLTDENGRFHLEGLPRERLTVHAWHPDFESRTVEAPAGGSVELTLSRAPPSQLELPVEVGEGKLGGVVVDDRGFPVTGARVAVGARVALSDRAGRFQLDGLPDGPYRVRVEHPDYAPSQTEVPEGDDARLQLQLGGGIDGDVRDARTGELPAGTTLELAFDGQKQRVSVGGDGRFSVTGVRPGRVTLTARAPGYPAVSRELQVPPGEAPREVTVRDVSLALERGGTVVGEVRDDAGDAVTGAQVTAGATKCRTDARGEFRCMGVAAGRVTVRAALGARRGGDEVEVRGDEESRVEITIR